jgi:hypothetical protein
MVERVECDVLQHGAGDGLREGEAYEAYIGLGRPLR